MISSNLRRKTMRVRNIKIAIKSEAELFNEVKEVCGKLERGEKVKKHEGVSFKDLETMRKILTEERLRILKTRREAKPWSTKYWRHTVERESKKTFDDVQYL